MPKYFDAHSHLNFSQFDEDRDELITSMKKEGVWTITVGTDSKTSKESALLAAEHDHLFATVGVHPTEVSIGPALSVAEVFDGELFTDLIKTSSRVVAIGECGFDFFRTPRENVYRDQQSLFESHVELALKHDLPLMLHCRPSKGSMDAYIDMIDVISNFKNQKSKWRGNVHFFVGSTEIASKFLHLGFTISFDGPITFTHEYDEVIRSVPLSMILAETDAPFAAPEPFRGKRNQPSYVKEVVRSIARIRGEDEELVRKATVENTLRVFGIDIAG